MDISPQVYKEMTEKASPKSNSAVNVSYAFFTGGSICLIGQLILTAFKSMGFSAENAGTWVSVILVFTSAFLTGTGLYSKLAKHAGAGTLVPITGFANAISSSAVEALTEGLITGVGTKIFTIAGPVILYGCTSAFMYGLIYYVISLFM
ncbi:MAG: SpoVA/SpoVAEb family sporulation membrane protein [Ruminococcus sp.]|nr:SpoVA/SpoVAEb family sporulation membrane protein [Ruminococcus sp.]